MIRSRLLYPWLLSVCLTVQAETQWPAQVVRIEEMKPLVPMVISVPRMRTKGDIRGPVVLRAHVDPQGQVQRVALMESCGSPAHDEAALLSMRSARFAPKVIDGVPVDVTLVVPLHLPLSKSASSQ